jgi:ribosomal protein L7Ae-like RNA K-turn-binding protein
MNDEKNLLGIIGICRGAGKAVIGTDMVCELLQKRSAKNKCKNDGKLDIVVIEASDTSENTHKKISDKCIYYNVEHIRLAATCEALGKAVGKRATAAIAIADPNFCRAVKEKMDRES